MFSEKVSLVTGGASGIGRALCQQLAGAGAQVIVADLNLTQAEETAAGIRNKGGKAAAAEVDVTKAEAVEALVAKTIEAHGRLDYLFNNAGVASVGEVLDTELSEWNRMIDVNLRGVIHGVHAAYPKMVEQGFGHIVNTASAAGLIPTPTMTAYAATKHAVVGLTKGLRAEAISRGVHVSAICPGIINTPMLDANHLMGVDRAWVDRVMPMKPYNVERCSRDILKGVARKQHIIVVTPHGKLGSLLYRWAPGLIDWFVARETARNRAR